MSYDGVVRASTPTWYWATRETSGTTLAEDMASANATLSGSGYTLHQSGFAGSIISIADSAGPYASGPATALSAAFVVEAIVEVYSGSSGWFAAYSYSTSDDPANSSGVDVLLGLQPGPNPTFIVNGVSITSSVTLGVGRHHLVGFSMYGGTQLALRVNKVFRATATYTSTSTSGGHSVIGGGVFGLNGHYGVGKVAVYNGLSASTPFTDAHYDEAVAGGGDAAPGAAPAFTGTATLSGSGSLTVPPPTTSGGTIVSTGAGVSSIDDVSLVSYPSMAVTILDKEIRRAPSAITFKVAGGLPETDVTFLMDVGSPVTGQDEVYTATLDTEGSLGPTSLTVLDTLGGQQGVRTLTATQNMPDSTVIAAFDTYEMVLPPILWPVAQGADLDPVDLPEAVINGVRHWVFQDLMGVEDGGIGSYVLDHNPREMSSPHLEFAMTSRHTTAHSGKFHVWQAGAVPHEWTFSGQTWSQEMLDQLQAYRALNRRFWIIDHRNRAWKSVITNLEIVPHLRQVYNGEETDLGTDWTVAATVLDQNFRTPV